MNTPINDFVRDYADSDFSRLHMPGHKGISLLGCEPLDITEIDGADVLYCADGIIKESEKNAASLFGTAASFYSTEGSTLCIKAMLSLICQGKKEKPLILAARNVHKAFIYAGALLDFDVEWMYGKENDSLCSLVLTAEEIESHILRCARKPDAVYITSPDYLGKRWNIRAAADVCDKYGIPLVVDNAHGAYLAFLEENQHPISLGATMCCDSAHKTLPVLTGGAYLHISEKGKAYLPFAEDCLSLHASTSPSYLIMQSLDLCNAYLAEGYREKLTDTVCKINELKDELTAIGIEIGDSEPLKLVISPHSLGYTGKTLGEYLYGRKISCEFTDRDTVVMMLTPENPDRDYERILSVMKTLPRRTPEELSPVPCLRRAEKKLSLREAVFAPSEWTDTEKAEGRICASPAVSCPPAVPVTVCGEIITKQAIEIFRAYGIERLRVVV